MHLEAIKPILYASTQFQPGDMLPADNVLLADAWVKSGAAAWICEKENEKNICNAHVSPSGSDSPFAGRFLATI